MTRFVATCALFHVLASILCVWAGREWRRAGSLPGSRRLGLAVVGAAFLGLSIVVLAVVASLAYPSGFTVLRLLSQALFGEILLLAAFVAVTEWRRSPPIGMAAAVLPAVLLASYWEGYHRGPERLQVETHVLDLSAGAPVGRIRLLHMSDLQTDDPGRYEEGVLASARALDPDLVVWTGDYVQPRTDIGRRPKAEADFRALLERQRIPAPLGQYAVRGDVDVHWPEVLAGTGVTALTEDVVRIPLPGGRHLRLVGLGSGTSRGHDQAALARTLGSVPPGDLSVVAGHNPSFATLLPGLARVDLVLAGHTHGGQVVVPLFGAPYTKSRLPRRYARGRHDYEGMALHVSAGIGMERGPAPQVRFLCPPEICLLDITY